MAEIAAGKQAGISGWLEKVAKNWRSGVACEEI
jgi:hypothetical protein